jgi:protein-L-isoaspartate(D-aspartate) O-methyltransferase
MTETARRGMVKRQLAARGIRDERVLAAMLKVPREAFVPVALRDFAYDDTPLPIGHGQTISQPFVVALMAQALALRADDSVLEIGTGSGYGAAVLAELAAYVDTIERHAPLAAIARERLRQQGYPAVAVHTGDGTLGWPAGAPYDAIVATACGPVVPPAWRAQLAVGGRLVMPVSDGSLQHLIRIVRRGECAYDEEDLGGVAFVPLIGEQGWADETARTHGPGL